MPTQTVTFPHGVAPRIAGRTIGAAAPAGRRPRPVLTLLGLLALAGSPAAAQMTNASAPTSVTVADVTDKTDTNPANLLDTVDLSNEFRSLDEGLYFDQVTWRYGQSFANHRLRARAELPLAFANVTGRTEAGFGDVVLGGEWVAVARTRSALVAGTDVGFDTGTNASLVEGHHTLAPSVTFVFAPRGDTVLSLRYRHRLSLGPVEDRPDIRAGTIEAALVRRFGSGIWLRAIPAAVFDYERDQASTRFDGEWGRVLAAGVSTWVRFGSAFGSQRSRPFDWTLATGFRFVR